MGLWLEYIIYSAQREMGRLAQSHGCCHMAHVAILKKKNENTDIYHAILCAVHIDVIYYLTIISYPISI